MTRERAQHERAFSEVRALCEQRPWFCSPVPLPLPLSSLRPPSVHLLRGRGYAHLCEEDAVMEALADPYFEVCVPRLCLV